jgi:hypothetical protein
MSKLGYVCFILEITRLASRLQPSGRIISRNHGLLDQHASSPQHPIEAGFHGITLSSVPSVALCLSMISALA